HRQPRRALHGAHGEEEGARREGRRRVRWPSTTRTPSRTRTPATGNRGPPRSPRARPAGLRHGSSESGSDGFFVPVGGSGTPRLQSRRRRVAGTYAFFDTPTIWAGSNIGACGSCSSRTSPTWRTPSATAYAWNRLRQTSPVTATPPWNC